MAPSEKSEDHIDHHKLKSLNMMTEKYNSYTNDSIEKRTEKDPREVKATFND